jgi:hypothetical protein
VACTHNLGSRYCWIFQTCSKRTADCWKRISSRLYVVIDTHTHTHTHTHTRNANLSFLCPLFVSFKKQSFLSDFIW